MKAEDIKALLARKYSGDGWFIGFEVRDTTGFEASRNGYADAIVMGTWPSHGFSIHGFEIKVNRADWQNELKHPEKAAVFTKHCDFFWVVAPPKIVLESEIPQNWGCMAAHANRLIIKKDAPRLSNWGETKMDRGFVASLIRHKRDPHSAEIQAKIKKAEDEARKKAKSQISYEHRTTKEELEKFQRADEEFEKRFGSSWRLSSRWPGANLAANRIKSAVELARTLDNTHIQQVESHAEKLLQIIREFKKGCGRPEIDE